MTNMNDLVSQLDGRDTGGGRDRGGRRDSRRRSRSRDRHSSRKDRDRSRSESPPPRRKRERKSGFDVLPPGGVIPGVGAIPGMAVAAAAAAPAASGFSAAPAGQVQPPSQQATRHARRIYVGGLPPTANEQNIATFFSNALAAVGGTTAGPGPCVINVYINYERKFAFVELRTVEETSNAMALDGIMFEGVSVRVRRPNDYNPAAAAALGPSVPNPALNLAAIGLSPGGMGAQMIDANERVFVGGLPYYLTEDQCRELLGSFGAIKSFDLVKDRETGNSKGYGFVVYGDGTVTDVACKGLNGMRMGDRTLTVRRATESKPDMNMPNMNAPAIPPPILPGSTHIVRLQEAVTMEELSNDEEYNDIMEDMQEECAKYGTIHQIIIPRPGAPSGVGKVILNFGDVTSAMAAQRVMNGRKFAGRTVIATFMTDDQLAAGSLD
ncbi:hypothetical protein WJX79_009108 [Trebouxia sp. C0005]|nr:MAG: splicing factor U2af large subunit B-like [Trebouxia sp. A1-2]